MTVGPPRFQPPPYAGVADLVDPHDLPVVPTRWDVPPPRRRSAADAVGETTGQDGWASDVDIEGQLDDAVVEAAAVPVDPTDRDGPDSREPLGHRVTRRFLVLCEHPRTRARTMRLLRTSADSAVGGRLLVAFLSRAAFRPMLRAGRLDHATARIELACAQLGGIAVLRYVTRMEPVASLGIDELVAIVGPSVDATLTAPYRRRDVASTAVRTTSEPRSHKGTRLVGAARWFRRG